MLPPFALTESNAPAVAQICKRLDGIPLAIELAAARVKVLSAEQIVARLDDRFRLLTGGSRTALPRHQTLHALIDWSYELLSDAERVLFRRLSVFRGGWRLEAAEAVCPCGEPAEIEVLDLLSGLVNKSLVELSEMKGRASTALSHAGNHAAVRPGEAGSKLGKRNRCATDTWPIFWRFPSESSRSCAGAHSKPGWTNWRRS